MDPVSQPAASRRGVRLQGLKERLDQLDSFRSGNAPPVDSFAGLPGNCIDSLRSGIEELKRLSL